MSGTSHAGPAPRQEGPAASHPGKGRRRFALTVLLFAALNGAAWWWIRDAGIPRGVLASAALVPAGGRGAPQSVRVWFSRDVVSAEPTSQPDPSMWIRVQPPAPGTARWVSPRELLFEAEEPLRLSCAYTLTVAPPADLPGTVFAGPLDFPLQTPTLKLLSVHQLGWGSPDAGAGAEDVSFRLLFNGPVAPESLEPHLRLAGGSSDDVALSVLTQRPAPEIDIRFRPVEPRYTLVFGSARDGEAARLQVDGDQTHRIAVTEALQVTRVIADRTSLETPSVEVYFTNALATGDDAPLESFIAVDPPVSVHATARWSMLRLDGPFQPGQRYRITVKKGLRGASRTALHTDITREVLVPDRQPTIVFSGRGTFLSSQGNLSLRLKTVNVKTVKLQASRIHANNLVHALEVGWPRESFTRPLQPRLYHTQPGLNEPRDLVVDLRDLVGGDPRGVWIVLASSGPGESERAEAVEQLVSVSDIGMTVKESAAGLMAWTVSLRAGQPLAGVAVSLRSRSNQLIAEKVTGSDGIAVFDQVPGQDGPPHVAVASWESDLAYLHLSRSRVGKAELDVGGRPYLQAGNEAFLHLDRGVYRPGETVRLRALVRGVNAALPGSFPVELETLRPDHKRYRLDRLTLSGEGAVDAAIALTPSAPTGSYLVRLRLPGDGREESAVLGEESFLVEEYMPQRLRVEVSDAAQVPGAAVPARRRPGEALEVRVQASHLFGLPAARAATDVTWSLKPLEFAPRAWRGFRFGESRGPELGQRFESRSLELDPNGEAIVKVDLPAIEAASPVALRFEARVSDVGGRAVAGGIDIPVDPAPHYLGLRVLEGANRIERGKAVRFECAAVKPDGTAAPLDVAELVLHACSWSSLLKRGADGRYHYESREELREVTRQRVQFASGRGAFELTLPDWGAYRLRLKDPASLALAELSVYAGGPGAVFSPASLEKPERLEIAFARDAYRPGETAAATVRAPFQGTLLVTLESDRVHWMQVVRSTGSVAAVQVPLPPQGSAGLFLGASMVRGIDPEAEWLPHRAFGIERVPIDFSARRLTVTLDAPGEARPDSILAARAVVSREDGEPVEGAEVLLSAVDEGILSLTGEEMPDPFAFFYGRRAHAVDTADTFLHLLAEVPAAFQRARPGGDGGGAGDKEAAARLNPVHVKRVTPAVLWVGPERTDASGAVYWSLRTPPITGSLRLTAVVSRGSDFGSSRRQLTLRAPFFFELGMPRFLAPGDRFQAPVSVFNRSPQGGAAALSWTLANLHHDDAPGEAGLAFTSAREALLDVPASGAARAAVWLRAGESAGKATARLDAVLAPESRSETVELAVRPAAPLVVSASTGAIAEGSPLKVEAPHRWLEGTGRWTLTLSHLPVLDLAESLQYLIDYPYGCLEQTTSRALPLLHLRELVEASSALHPDGPAAPAPPGLNAIDGFVGAGIDRILDMQTEAGWLSMHPGGRQPATWATVYATQFLVEARKAGYAVPESDLEAALRYVAAALVRDAPAGDASRILHAAYGAYVLALAGRADRGAMERLRELAAPRSGGGPGGLDPGARAFLACAYLVSGERAVSGSLLEGIGLESDARAESGGSLRSPARDDAVLLNALVETDPDDPRIPALVERLRSRRQHGRWTTTQDNAFALLALGKHARKLRQEPAAYTAEVIVPGEAALTLAAGENRTLRGAGAIPEVHVTGAGKLFYWLRQEGVPEGGTPVDADSGMRIRRELLNTSFERLDLQHIAMGDDVVVRWTLESAEALDNVVVSDLLPAGIEVENPRLGGTGVRGEDKDFLAPEHVTWRDDRVVGFFNVPAGRRCVYLYAARAVTRGEFQLPPIAAEAMYRPDVRSIHGAARVVVK